MNHQELNLPRFCVPLILKDKEDFIGRTVLALIATYTGYQLYKITSSSLKDSSRCNDLRIIAKKRRDERNSKRHQVLDEVSRQINHPTK